MTTSTILAPTRVLLADLAETVSVTMSNGTKALKGYAYEPGAEGFDEIPALAVGPSEGDRGDVDGGERELGSDDWFLRFPVSIYVDLDNATKAQIQMDEALEGYGKAIDADPSLGEPLIDDCKLTNWVSFVAERGGRNLCGYEFTVSVWRRNPY